jgi:hypothetical protein
VYVRGVKSRTARIIALLAATLIAAWLAAPARADFSGGTSGGSTTYTDTGPGGGGGGMANFWMFPSSNYGHIGDLHWFPGQDTYVPTGGSPDYPKYDQEMTLALLGYPNDLSSGNTSSKPSPDPNGDSTRCNSGGWDSNSKCPFWYTRKVQQDVQNDSSGGAANISYNDHSSNPLNIQQIPVNYVGAKATIVAWNVLIWRWDPSVDSDSGQNDRPIFSRTVDLYGQTVCNLDYTSGCVGATSAAVPGIYDQYWYYADAHAPGSPPSPFGVGSSGGSFSDPSWHTNAGPLSTTQSTYALDQQTCNNHWNNSYNGLRDAQGGSGTPHISDNLAVPGNGGSSVRPKRTPYYLNGYPTTGSFSCY